MIWFLYTAVLSMLQTSYCSYMLYASIYDETSYAIGHLPRRVAVAEAEFMTSCKEWDLRIVHSEFTAHVILEWRKNCLRGATQHATPAPMIVILSPAKTLNLKADSSSTSSTAPSGAADADYLASELRKLPIDKLRALLGVTDKLASLNFERYQSWDDQEQKQCIFSYDGPAFKNLRAETFTPDDLNFANEHVRIVSGLYGLLRPLDQIKAYRLEMSTRLANNTGKDLYIFWREKLTSQLREELHKAPNDQQFLVNCASKEYAKAVDMKGLGARVYQIIFQGPGLFTKAARGAMVRYIVSNRIKKPEQLQQFTGNDGEWRFDESLSSDFEYTFQRSTKKPRRAAPK